MTRFTAAALITAWLAANGFARAEQPWSMEEKRVFVEKCLQDTNVYVFNVPRQMRRQLNLTAQQAATWRQHASTEGTLLYLYPDGSPWAYWSNDQGERNGPAKSWYTNGQLAADEILDHEKVVTGHYYDESGKSVGEMINGTGRLLSLEVQSTSQPAPMSVMVADYRDGLPDGLQTTSIDGVKVLEAHFTGGKANGLLTRWDRGRKLLEENYQNGKLEGTRIVWFPGGQTNVISRCRDGQIEASEVFYPDGTRFKESVYGADKLTTEKFFYASGALMAERTAKENEIINARSLDPSGKLNSEVKDGNGTLVMTFEHLPRLEVYRDGARVKSQKLPFFKLAPGAEILAGATNNSTFHLSVILDDEIKAIKVDLHLPTDVQSDRKLSFTGTNIIGAGMFGPFELRFPAAYHEWKDRDTLVEAEVELKEMKVRYQSYAIHEKLD